MFGLYDQLQKLETSVRIGIVGIGSIGRGMVLQADLTPGIDCVAIADLQRFVGRNLPQDNRDVIL